VDYGLINNYLNDRENKSSVKPTILLWQVDTLVYFLHARRVWEREREDVDTNTLQVT